MGKVVKIKTILNNLDSNYFWRKRRMD